MSSSGSEPPSIPGFEHVRLLGSGRFADVHLYQQHFPRRLVAVKVIKEHLLTWEAEHAFELEANALASLSSHPCIVAIHHAGRSTDGHAYLVMEYCALPTLAEQVKTKPFTAAQALRIGILLAGAVDTAHAHGIVHRDIKPSNVLMTDYGAPKLADFGIASSAWDRSAVTGFTPAWAPPELITGEAIATASTDVYSIAATVYTLLAGHAPHIRPGGGGSSVEDIAARATARQAPALPAETPSGVSSVLSRALSRDPRKRYQTAREFGEALQQAQEELGLTTTSMTLVAPPAKPPTETEGAGSASTWRRAATKQLGPSPEPHAKGRHRRWLAWMGAVVVLGTVAAVLTYVFRADSDPDRASEPKQTGGPLELAIPYENQPCSGKWIVSLSSPHDESVWVSKLQEATEGLGRAKYLKNSESCETLAPSYQGLDIYQAYTGPFSSVEQACAEKLSYPRPLAVVRQLSRDSPDRGLCFCLESAEALPMLGAENSDPRLPADQALVADVQYLLIRQGLNPERLNQGHFSSKLTQLLREYQSRKGLVTTGVIDKETWASLHDTYCSP